MQLNELIGIKKEISKNAKLRTVERRLEIHGFEMLGDGGSGSVWHYPGMNYVLKLFMSEDQSYLDFVRMVQADPSNPHFPRFRGRPINLTKHVMAVRMEPLKKWQPNDASALDRAIVTLMGVIHDRQGWKHSLSLRHEGSQRDVAIAFRKWPQLEGAVQRMVDFKQAHAHAMWDLHHDNIMKRGNMPVFTDPFTYW